MRLKYIFTLAFIIIAMLSCEGAQLKQQELQLMCDANYASYPVASTLELVFNRAPHYEERNVSIEPAMPINVLWSADGKTVQITAVDRLSYDTKYVLRAAGLVVELITEPVPRVSIIAGGDVLLDKMPGENIALHSPAYVFAGVTDLLNSADIAFANLESPASKRGQKISPKSFTFRSTPEALDALVEASIDVVAFANNHSLDFGEEAFLDTLEHLRERNIACVGAGVNRKEALSAHIVDVNGVRLAFLAFMQKSFLPAWSYDLWEATDDKPGVVFLDGEQGREDVLTAVEKTREMADVVIVSLHWGYEGTLAPQAWQRDLGREIIDAGASAIIGHHPHMPFGIELHAGKPIIYSLGNFLFHPYDVNAKESFVAYLDLNIFGDVSTKLYPILMEQGTVTQLYGEQAVRVLNIVSERSQRLGTTCLIEGDYAVLTSQ